MSLPPVIHATAIRNAVTPAGEWTATARAASIPYVPAAALEAAQARIAALEEALKISNALLAKAAGEPKNAHATLAKSG